MSDLVTITVERLKKLEALEAKIKIQQALDLKRLIAHDKAHPERVLERAKRYQNKDRDAYNARRRELRRQKKEAAAAAAAAAPGDENTASA